ncbi:hypothetical protein AGR7B_pAt0132 [Agrobacterium deltaense RV3]|nr:hypothetical protein AGR7B_pAt0132 [Agrobacterium deltaense RV3]
MPDLALRPRPPERESRPSAAFILSNRNDERIMLELVAGAGFEPALEERLIQEHNLHS